MLIPPTPAHLARLYAAGRAITTVITTTDSPTHKVFRKSGYALYSTIPMARMWPWEKRSRWGCDIGFLVFVMTSTFG